MRKARLQRSQTRKFSTVLKVGLLALITAVAAPGYLSAAVKTCNPDLDFTILNEGPHFLGDTMRISANVGAKDIAGGSAQFISAFGFALNCHLGEDYETCTDAGNTVQFLGNPTTDCLGSDGNPANLLVPQGNKIPIKATPFPIETAAGEQCNVQFDMKVTALNDPENPQIVQAMGWPFEGEKATTCDNGLTSEASATLAFTVETCDIELQKQAYDVDQEIWVDADTEEGAALILDSAQYRLVVKNTGSAGYVEDITVSDPKLGIETTYAFPTDSNQLILTNDQVSGLTQSRCGDPEQLLLSNTATVGATCRTGDNPVTASDSDTAWVRCPTDVREASIGLQKYTNGEDADQPTGPAITVGSPIQWTYVVTNGGDTELTNIVVTDDQGVEVTCPATELAVKSEMTCTGSGTAVEGQYANIGSVTADSPVGPVSDTDPSHYFGVTAVIDIEKATNGEDADTPTGPKIPVGETVTWTYVVTNNSNQTLTAVAVSDNQLGAVTCPKTELAAGESMTCTETGTAEAGQYANIGTAVGTPPVGTPVQDADPSHYFGVEADLVVEKSVENVLVDESGDLHVTYRVSVTNNGDDAGVYDLEDELLVDEALDATGVSGVTYVAGTDAGQSGTLNDSLTVGDFYPAPATLVSGESIEAGADESFEFIVTFEIDGTKTTVEGANCNPDDDNGTNTGLTNYVEVLVDGEAVDDARACDEFELTPDIELVKEIYDETDGWVKVSGPVQAPSGALYRLKVTNTGNITLLSVLVTDPMLGDPEAVYYEFGPLLVGEEYIIEAGQGADGSWPLLDVDEVCGQDDRGDHTNKATAAGMWEVDGDTVTAESMATLQCIGPPDIAILKEISINDGPFLDANEAPWPTAVFDPENPVPAEYRLTVSNASTEGVDLFNVVVNDDDLGIVNYSVGDLPADSPAVVIDSGDIAALAVTSLCGNIGEVSNLASTTGTSAAGESNTADDPATAECVGKPDITLLKEVSSDDVSYAESTTATAPADGFWRITVTNTGDVPLTNVTIDDAKLSIVGMPVPDLDPGDSVTVVWGNPVGDQLVNSNLYQPGFCDSYFTDTNTASTMGDSIYGGDSVGAQDSTVYNCVDRVDWCIDNNRPTYMKMMYDGDDDSLNDQGASFVQSPSPPVDFPDTPVTIKTYNSTKNRLLDTFSGLLPGGMFYIEDTNESGKIPPTIKIEFYDDANDGALLKTVWFHGSCSAPLSVGDEYSAATIIYITDQ